MKLILCHLFETCNWTLLSYSKLLFCHTLKPEEASNIFSQFRYSLLKVTLYTEQGPQYKISCCLLLGTCTVVSQKSAQCPMASRLFQNCRSENCVVCGSRINSIVLRIDSIVTRIDSIATRIDSILKKSTRL